MFSTSSGTATGGDHHHQMMLMERKWKPHIEVAPNCPRCASSNTKFCYYNNYSLSQPRYFCKGCRRYWTKGGSLRNVPVGGGCRKSRRSKSANKGGAVSCARQVASPDGQSTDDNEGGAEIDLAAVFAKYVNQVNSNSNDDQDSSSGACSSGSLKSSSVEEDTMFSNDDHHYYQFEDVLFDQSQNPSEFLSDLLHLDDHDQAVSVGENVDHHPNLFELQSIVLDDETSQQDQDMVWSLSDSTSLPDFAWQQPPPIVQLGDFGSFSTEDHLNMPSSADHLGSDHHNYWSSFDFPGYENFPRP